jgi:Sodium:neurotransmitter symporter family
MQNVTTTKPVPVNWINACSTYVAGVGRISTDIQSMIGHKPNYFWLACWTVISPLILLVSCILVVAKELSHVQAEYSNVGRLHCETEQEPDLDLKTSDRCYGAIIAM